MTYLDTNILIYALCKNVDNEEQKIISQNILREAVKNKELLLSEVILYEYAFVAKKLREEETVINDNLNFLINFCQHVNEIEKEVIQLMSQTSTYKQSFDAYHISFCNHFNCKKIITFDVGFKKFKNISSVDIEIL